MTTTKLNVTSDSESGLLPDPLVARRYRRTPRTIDRWDTRPELAFPKPIRIRGRKYRRITELENWELARAAAS
jgi:hypothetical protein